MQNSRYSKRRCFLTQTCDFCFRHCAIREGSYGYCQERTVRNGKLEDRAYGHLASAAIDPIEKKPLYHFLPRSRTLSIAMGGCSFSCAFCQNHEIAKRHNDGYPFIAPHHVVDLALEKGLPSISFTYTEPIVWQDYVQDVAILAKTKGLKTVMVTNGAFSEEALTRLLPLIDAYNIDVKGDECFYHDICKGELAPVLDSIKRITDYGSHLEVTTLIIEGFHTSAIIEKLGKELKERGVNVWHITRFFPSYKMMAYRATSEEYLETMIESAEKSGIPFIYPGNSRITRKQICPECKTESTFESGFCSACGKRIYGVY